MARPFEGLTGETDWVALREIVPAATATVPLRSGQEVSIATVLPMAWRGVHRADGTMLIGLQTGTTGSDASRDYAAAILELLDTPPGQPLPPGRPASAADPRLQDLLVPEAPFEVQLYDGFDFWVADGVDMDEAARQSLENANASIVPTSKLSAADSAYWCRVGERTHLRWVLPQQEDLATDALARLHAAGADLLGEQTRLLGAFRACGLLIPVWDLDPALGPEAYEEPLAAVARRYTEALAEDTPLSSEQRRARAGLLSRQLTLR